MRIQPTPIKAKIAAALLSTSAILKLGLLRSVDYSDQPLAWLKPLAPARILLLCNVGVILLGIWARYLDPPKETDTRVVLSVLLWLDVLLLALVAFLWTNPLAWYWHPG